MRGAGWSGTITLLGRGDFDGDGAENLMVKRTGGVQRGTAVQTSLFLLTKTPEHGCLHVVRQVHQGRRGKAKEQDAGESIAGPC